MSREWDHGRAPSPRLNHQQQNIGSLGVSTDLDIMRNEQIQAHPLNQGRFPYSAPPTSTSRIPDRRNPPTRSSTVSASDPDRNLSASFPYPKARSEDLNHASTSNYNQSFSSSSPMLSPVFLSSAGSRPSTPGDSSQSKHPSASSYSDHSPLTSLAYYSSAHSEESSTNSNSTTSKAPRTSSTSTSLASTYVFSNLLNHIITIILIRLLCSFSRLCSACSKAVQGPFVRALGAVFHLNCFKCLVRLLFVSCHCFISL
jgi:hypothetical protein